MSLLSVEGLVKNYGRRRVVDGVDFHVEAGEIVGLLGPNGAGKTTSFRMTCGVVIPDSGRVLLDDDEITDWPMYKRARDGGMGYLAQEQSVFRKLTVEQNLLAILITDHRERETLAITDRSYVIRAGKVLCHGTADEVLNHPDAKKYYFGESHGVTAA